MKSTSTTPQGTTRRAAMKGGIGLASLAATGTRAVLPTAAATASVTVMTDAAQAQQAAASPWSLTQPATGVLMHPDYARTIAQMAYVWGGRW
ncbi:hypothetical protein [Microvirga zambiensis]|uniref:hypothetical protein n=1 Tax=Microvirga zambiensis TaxID=1402137 RepID=UPI001FEB8691|nr:hypothetical protein [Microvirga zambiensis]